MSRHLSLRSRAWALALVLGWGSPAVWAEKPDWAGGGRPDKGERPSGPPAHERHRDRHEVDRPSRPPVRSQDGQGASIEIGVWFGEAQRSQVRRYYADEARRGKCPPGLAKKGNGCQPPGQAKAWRKGAPLPRDVVYYDVPERLAIRLGPPPALHRYVRVGADILLIAIGTAIVVDAIEDLSGL